MLDQLMSDFFLVSPLLPTLSKLTFTVLMALVSSYIVVLSYSYHFNANNSSRQYKLTLLIVGVIACVLTIVVGSNLARAFGLFGSFSLIRFRKSFKRVEEVAFLFWSIGCGVAVGSGLYMGAVLVSVLIYWTVHIYLRKVDKGHAVQFGIHFIVRTQRWETLLAEIEFKLKQLDIFCIYDQNKTILAPSEGKVDIHLQAWSYRGFDLEVVLGQLSEVKDVENVSVIT